MSGINPPERKGKKLRKKGRSHHAKREKHHASSIRDFHNGQDYHDKFEAPTEQQQQQQISNSPKFTLNSFSKRACFSHKKATCDESIG